MLGFLGATRAAAGVGPKQQACIASGGSWEGPMGKKKCVGGGGSTAIVKAGALPKPGSTITGPIPAEWAGSEKKGEAGPKQQKCASQGGHWIGPEGRRWCQLEQIVPAVTAMPSPSPAGLPVDTGSVPRGAEVVAQSSGLPQTGGGFEITPEMYMAPGLQTEATGAPGDAATGATYVPASAFSGKNLLIIAAVGIAGFFVFKKLRKKKS